MSSSLTRTLTADSQGRPMCSLHDAIVAPVGRTIASLAHLDWQGKVSCGEAICSLALAPIERWTLAYTALPSSERNGQTDGQTDGLQHCFTSLPYLWRRRITVTDILQFFLVFIACVNLGYLFYNTFTMRLLHLSLRYARIQLSPAGGWGISFRRTIPC